MTVMGTVKNGVVILERKGRLPEGARVRVESLTKEKQLRTRRELSKRKSLPPVAKVLLKYAGCVKGPSDWAENHDHYIHGTPKRNS